MSQRYTPEPKTKSEDIPFTPVPVRAQRGGWSEERQRDFVRALARIGSVSTAARSVGKTRRSAYQLRGRPGAESFAAAWDQAAIRGFRNVHDHVIDRALNGAVVPRFYAGRQTGLVHRFYDSVAIAVLSGRGVSLTERLEEFRYQAYFEVERAWRRDIAWSNEEIELKMIAEAKLERLVRAGIIGPEWLDRENRNPPLPNAAAAPAQEPAERLGPRILQL